MLLGLLLSACTPDVEFVKQTGHAAVFPSTLDFGEVPVDYSSGGYVTLQNTGAVELAVGAVTTDDTEGVFTLSDVPTAVPSKSEAEIYVQFLPGQITSYANTLTIETDDPENPTVTVALVGAGVETPTPDISLDRLSVDYGSIAATGVPVLNYVTIENVGEGTLTISDVTQTGSGAFAIADGLEGATLGEGESTNALIQYTPTSMEGDNGSFTLLSNDPDEPEVTVTLIGNGGGDFLYPVAVVDAPATAEPRDTVTLDGSGSYDPNGFEPLTYQWTLVDAPAGSIVELQTPTNLDRAYLQVDLAGDYTVALQVTNSVGLLSVPAQHVIEVLPAEALHVELTWESGGADFDLHLLNGVGTLFEIPTDCNYCNQNPDWGTPVDGTDDPTLVLDDRSGYGPEEITIEDPAADTYSVRVHYYTENGDSDVVATANIWVFGELLLTSSRVMSRNDVWDVGQITFPDGTVYEESTDLYAAAGRTCE